MSIQSVAHGWYSIVPTVFTTLGWLLGLFQDGCDFVRVEGDVVAEIASQPNAPYLEAGRNAYREPRYNAHTDSWHVEYVGSCLVYPPEVVTMDGWWNVAKGFDFASLVLGGTSSLFLWFSVCCVFSRGTWRLAGMQVLLACIFQAASFLWFQTELCQDNTCILFWGSNSDIAACVFWFLAALLILCHYPVPKEHLMRLEGQASTDSGDGLMITTGSGNNAAATATAVDGFATNVDHGGDIPTTTLDEQQQQQTPDDETKEQQQVQDEPLWYQTQPTEPTTSATATATTTQAGQDSGEASREDERPASEPTPAQIV